MQMTLFCSQFRFEIYNFLVEMCQTEFTIIGIEFNATKSACIRVRIRHNSDVHLIIPNAEPLPGKKKFVI